MDQHDYPVISEQTVTVGAYAMNNTFSNRWTLSYPLYTGGRLEGQADAGGYALNAADLTLENARQLVRYQAEEAYWGLVHRQDLVKVAKDAVDRSNIQLQLIDAQYDEGAVAKADVLIMQVRLANHRQNLVTAEGNLKVAKATLASIVGLPQDTDIQTIDTLPYERYPLSLNECEAFAVEHRPDFAAAEYEVKRGEAQMDAAKSGYRPAVTALFSKNMSSNEPFRDERSSAWNAGLDFSWNIFDNAVTSAKVASAKAQVAQYQAEAELLGKNVRLETRSAYFRMKAAEENIDAAASAVKQAEESCMIAEVRYEEGVDILLNLTDAQEQLTQAQSNYYTALYEYNLYRAALAKAMGIPVGMSVPRYLAAARAGKSSSQAMEEAAVSMEPSGSLTEQE